MRITCPNCTAGFEIPTELLGRKGRSLKCATCGHSWFQAAVVDEIDLGDVLAESKAAAAAVDKDMGGPKGGGGGQRGPEVHTAPLSGRREPDTQAIAAAANAALQGISGGPVAQAPPSDIPPGAKSILSRNRARSAQNATAPSMRGDGG